MPKEDNRPFPMVLEVELLDRMSEPVREGRVKSVSEIVRRALERFDFQNLVVLKRNLLQISVRLPAALRHDLLRHSRKQHTSIGHLVRAAVEAYLPELETGADRQLEMPIETPLLESTEGAPPPAPAPPKRKRPASRRKKTSPAGKRGARKTRGRTMTKKRKG